MGAYDVDDFQTQVIERSRQVPVMVDFWAEWCGPCRMLGPVLEKLADDAGGRWDLAKIDTESHQDIAIQYGIRSIPAVKLFVDGEVVDEFTGALPEPQVRAWIDRALPSGWAAQTAQALELAAAGDEAGAAVLLEEVIAEEPSNETARVALARVLLWDEPERARVLTEEIGTASEHADLAGAISDIVALFATLDDPDGLPQGPARTTYLAAIATLRGRDVASALDGFISVLGTDRNLDDEGARRACLALFQLLGDDDPVTRQYRPVFASALYS
jgi:putative thioredoxin